MVLGRNEDAHLGRDYPDDEVASRSRRNALDVANQIDEQMAKRLVDLIDDDPARKSAKMESAKQLRIQETRQAVIEAKQNITSKQSELMADACWEALGSLNSGRCAPSKPADLSNYIEVAAREGIENTFPIFLWYLRNLEMRFEMTSETETTLKPQLEVLLMVSDLANRIVRRLCDKDCLSQSYRSGYESRLISPTDREEAFEHICNFAERIEGDELLICDPYFGPEDIEIIKKIHFKRLGLKYTVLISPNSDVKGQDVHSLFAAAWRNISDTQPPPIRIVIVMFKGTHKGAIHDRWLLGQTDGMRVGASMNGLGSSRWSEISIMNQDEAMAVRNELLRFARLEEWFSNGVQVDYEVATVQ